MRVSACMVSNNQLRHPLGYIRASAPLIQRRTCKIPSSEYQIVYIKFQPMDKFGYTNSNGGDLELSESAMDSAAADSHLIMVCWLHQHFSARCTTEAMDNASANERLQTAQWLGYMKIAKKVVLRAQWIVLLLEVISI